MDNQIEIINTQLKQEKERYKQASSNLNKKKNDEYNKHQKTIEILTNRKEQLKKSESLFAKLNNKLLKYID